MAHTRTRPAELRQLTVLACDIPDSTPMAGRLRAEGFSEVISPFRDCCDRVIRDHGGTVVKHLGDGLLAVFGRPASEDAVHDAVVAALAICEAVPHLDTEVPLAVRVGVHYGECVVEEFPPGTEPAFDILGEAPNLVNRLQTQAPLNSVLISGAVEERVRGRMRTDPKEVALKGIERDVPVFQVLGRTALETRSEASPVRGRLVGREAELAALRDAVARARPVLLLGEPGIGKTRLVRELETERGADAGTAMSCYCAERRADTPFYPLARMLELRIGARASDTAAERLEALRRRLAGMANREANVPLLRALVESRADPAAGPQLSTDDVATALREWLAFESGQGLQLFVVEDLHWADLPTRRFVRALAGAPPAGVSVVLTARPNEAPEAGQRTQVRADFEQYLRELPVERVLLQRLSPEAAAEFVGEMPEASRLSRDDLADAVRRSEGLPLYAEELVRFLAETEAEPTMPSAVPTGLHDLLVGRLDRVAAAKEVAQIASIFGREVPQAVLYAIVQEFREVAGGGVAVEVGGDEADVDRHAATLVAHDLWERTSVDDAPAYRFRHLLIQDAAQSIQLRYRRQQTHQAIAQVLDRQFREAQKASASPSPYQIAHHYLEGGHGRSAAPFLLEAGRMSMSRGAHPEAIEQFERAIQVLSEDGADASEAALQLELLTELGRSLTIDRGMSHADVREAYARAAALADGLADAPRRFAAVWGLWSSHLVRGGYQEARHLADRCREMADESEEPSELVEAIVAQGITDFWTGEIASAHARLEEGLARWREHQQIAEWAIQHPAAVAEVHQALIHSACWGRFSEAAQLIDEALGLAQDDQLSAPMRWYTEAYVRCYAAAVLTQLGRAHEALEHAVEAERICARRNIPLYRAAAKMNLGVALANYRGGDITHPRTAGAELKQGIDAWEAIGGRLALPNFRYRLADVVSALAPAEVAVLGLGDDPVTAGIDQADQGLALVERTGERQAYTHLLRQRGTLRLRLSPPDLEGATADLRAAYDWADQHGDEIAALAAALTMAAIDSSGEWGERPATHYDRLPERDRTDVPVIRMARRALKLDGQPA